MLIAGKQGAFCGKLEVAMKIRTMITVAIIGCIGFLGVCAQSTAAAAGPVGEWKIADGTANVAIKPCGGNLCGYVSWAKEPASLVGRQVLIDMTQNGAIWAGTVVNVANGQQYTARMTLVSEQTLKIEGCVMGGMICGGQHWSRVK
jgi:uncharacterized protein (DUF2147 family)